MGEKSERARDETRRDATSARNERRTATTRTETALKNFVAAAAGSGGTNTHAHTD